MTVFHPQRNWKLDLDFYLGFVLEDMGFILKGIESDVSFSATTHSLSERFILKGIESQIFMRGPQEKQKFSFILKGIVSQIFFL